MSSIKIAGLNKATVLSRLYNASKQQGLGFCNPRGSEPMTPSQAEALLADRRAAGASLYFDYLNGRVMKISLDDDEMDVRLYDRDNGVGAAERALSVLIAD